LKVFMLIDWQLWWFLAVYFHSACKEILFCSLYRK